MRILSILLLLVASQSSAQKIEMTNHMLYSITVSIDHISYPGNKKYRPTHPEYPRHSRHRGWGISAGVDIPFSKNYSNHFQWSQSFRAGYLNNPGINSDFVLARNFRRSSFFQIFKGRSNRLVTKRLVLINSGNPLV